MVLGCPLAQGYGLTETGAATFLQMPHEFSMLGGVGVGWRGVCDGGGGGRGGVTDGWVRCTAAASGALCDCLQAKCTRRAQHSRDHRDACVGVVATGRQCCCVPLLKPGVCRRPHGRLQRHAAWQSCPQPRLPSAGVSPTSAGCIYIIYAPSPSPCPPPRQCRPPAAGL